MSAPVSRPDSARTPDPNDPKKKGKVGEGVVEFSKQTSFHGVHFLSDDESTSIQKIVWMLLLLGGSGFLVYQVYQKLQVYKRNPIVTNIDMEYPTDMPFPAIAICNNNQFRMTKVWNNIYEPLRDLYKEKKKMDIQAHREAFAKLSTQDAKQFLQEAAHDINDMLLEYAQASMLKRRVARVRRLLDIAETSPSMRFLPENSSNIKTVPCQ